MSDELARVLRDGMAAEVRSVSAGPEFTERVIGQALAAGGPAGPDRRPPWQNWILPVAAAALVALLVGSVLIGTKLVHSAGPANKPNPALSQPSSPAPSDQASPGPSGSASSSPAPSASRSTGAVGGPVGGPVPAGFHAVDLTWVSNDLGWALGTAPCANRPCTSILRTRDGGKSWVGIPAPRAFLTETDTCSSACDRISNLRFASPLIGYAFGPYGANYLTTDGGASWHQQSVGDTWGLEVVAGSVLRITARAPSGGGCTPPGCSFGLQRAAIGSDSWQDVALPAGGRDVGAQLAASGNTVVLASYAHVSGGAENATSVLFTSTDAGNNWHKVGEPCPQRASGEVDSTSVTVATGGSITVLCQPRTAAGPPLTVTSTDGVHFTPGAAVPGSQPGGQAGASSARNLFVLQQAQLYRSTDAGAHWAVVAGPPGGDWIGFESATVGRVIAGSQAGRLDGTWTTTDGGQSWSYHPFG